MGGWVKLFESVFVHPSSTSWYLLCCIHVDLDRLTLTANLNFTIALLILKKLQSHESWKAYEVYEGPHQASMKQL